MTDRAEVLKRFLHDTDAHEMAVELDQGLHRHLRFRKPGTYCYGFDIVTWPGYLAISGDMGAAVFSRTADMMEFFRPSLAWQSAHPGELCINPAYWGEKCVANAGELRKFDEQRLESAVKGIYTAFLECEAEDAVAREQKEQGLWHAISDQVLCALSVEQAIAAMDSFDPADSGFPDFQFSDAWEHGYAITDYDFHFIWRLYAIAHAVKAYDALHAAQLQPEAAHAP